MARATPPCGGKPQGSCDGAARAYGGWARARSLHVAPAIPQPGSREDHYSDAVVLVAHNLGDLLRLRVLLLLAIFVAVVLALGVVLALKSSQPASPVNAEVVIASA